MAMMIDDSLLLCCKGIKERVALLCLFRAQASEALCKRGKADRPERGRQSKEVEARFEATKHKGPAKLLPCKDARLDEIAHFSMMTPQRGRRKLHDCQETSRVMPTKRMARARPEPANKSPGPAQAHQKSALTAARPGPARGFGRARAFEQARRYPLREPSSRLAAEKLGTLAARREANARAVMAQCTQLVERESGESNAKEGGELRVRSSSADYNADAAGHRPEQEMLRI
ncbi:hypothetical protein HPB47_028415 [Ixodes persulcatus]|uniref:Uncharacterized protein n=1 Tax=Ixodes persulcatus TaxID=34615 RepID=A0AC60PTA2_IXOPE|nr:hypothetical protein HPB47_028415 [Ixodes persulcatus]